MKRLILAIILTSAFLSSCGANDSASPYAEIRTSADTDGFAGLGLDEPYQLPVVDFFDTNGQLVHWPEDGSPWPVTVVLFAYTNCPDVCSTQLADLTAARRGLSDDQKSRVGLVMITTDPERDSAAAIRAYLDRYSTDYVGLRTDDAATLEVAAQSLGVALTGKEASPDGKGYEVGHGAQLIAFDSSGRAPVMWLPGTAVRDIRADLGKLLGE